MLLFNNTRGRQIDFKAVGFNPIRLFTSYAFFEYDRVEKKYKLDKGYQRSCLETAIRSDLQNDELVILDIEHLRHNLAEFSESDVNAGLKVLMQVASDFHTLRPNIRVGYYRIIPIRDFWVPVNYHLVKGNPKHVKYKEHARKFYEWKRANSRLKYTPTDDQRSDHRGLADVVDFVAPSLYIVSRDLNVANPMEDQRVRDFWPVFCAENIDQARQYNKPIYAYLMREYHPSTVGQKHIPIEPEVVKFQLDTLEQLDVDGVIFFSMDEFDSGDTWWNAVKQWVSNSRLIN